MSGYIMALRMSVYPSGLLPSDVMKPDGSLMAGTYLGKELSRYDQSAAGGEPLYHRQGSMISHTIHKDQQVSHKSRNKDIKLNTQPQINGQSNDFSARSQAKSRDVCEVTPVIVGRGVDSCESGQKWWLSSSLDHSIDLSGRT
jgi:hypothetical protein